MARFAPGKSGNPGGRPRGQGAARQIARDHAAAAVIGLARVCCDGRSTPAQVQRAAAMLLRYGFGDPEQARGSPAGARGRYPGLRRLVVALLDEQDREQAAQRRRALLELDAFEREEGLSELPAGWTEVA